MFKQRGEFFRESTTTPGNFSLILRRALEGEDVVRAALVVKVLIEAAIALHGRQFQQKVDRRWAVNLALPFAGSLIGAVLGQASGFVNKYGRA
jgi:hypothetical protein